MEKISINEAHDGSWMCPNPTCLFSIRTPEAEKYARDHLGEDYE